MTDQLQEIQGGIINLKTGEITNLLEGTKKGMTEIRLKVRDELGYDNYTYFENSIVHGLWVANRPKLPKETQERLDYFRLQNMLVATKNRLKELENDLKEYKAAQASTTNAILLDLVEEHVYSLEREISSVKVTLSARERKFNNHPLTKTQGH